MTRGVGGESPANVATYLKGIDYPANKQDLLQHARQKAPSRMSSTSSNVCRSSSTATWRT